MRLLRSNWPILVLVIVILFFYRSFFIEGRLPVPSDTIVGLYHPFRDFYSKDYPTGIPFKNFLITDPVRQLIPWRELSVDLLKKGEVPFWNPYNMAGTPLLANFQSAVFYPLNIIFFIFPFVFAWSLLILLQPILASLFMYFYLRNLEISKLASFFGGLAFSFSGFTIAWLTWGTVGHVMLWLPLILLAIDKIVLSAKDKKILIWSLILVFSLTSSFFAGHLQTFFYLFIATMTYFFARWIQFGKKGNILFLFLILNTLFIILTAIQWLPTLQFIFDSARNIDQDWQKPGWFIPVQHLVQFIAPDFFGNPTTLNYFGVWNYAEFIGYVGILPLIFSLYAIVWHRSKKTLFFTGLIFASFVFSIQNPISELPYRLNIPFLSTSQPTRLLGIIDFSLAVLAAFGLDYLLKRSNFRKIIYVIILIAFLLTILWLVAMVNNFDVSKRNLILPSILFIISSFGMIAFHRRGKTFIQNSILGVLILITIFDLLRFADKFTPFAKKDYFFPKTKTIEFLKEKENEEGQFRFMTTDSRIFPPNFSIFYKLQSVDGYDPLYLRRYAELIAANERGKPNIDPPFGFNRIITPHVLSKITNLLNVKYILSLDDKVPTNSSKVFEEGQLKVYQNQNVLPRAFFVEELRFVLSKQEAINILMHESIDVGKVAVLEEDQRENFIKITGIEDFVQRVRVVKGDAKILSYKEHEIVIKTESNKDSFLILSDNYYPGWKATLDHKMTLIFRVDYTLRGIFVPKGTHEVRFFY